MLRKILVVDDNNINRQILKNILQSDYLIKEAVNGREALDILKIDGDSVSAVLLDIIMPVMDGYDVLRAMRADDILSNIPVIVTTANSEDGAEVKALSIGANDYIVKPYNPAIIKRRLLNTIVLRESAAIVNAARIDALTGLYSRETFFERAEEMVATKPDGFYTMSSFDINSFKVLNDQYGYAKGNAVLKFIAGVIGSIGEIGGICCRVMADKFALLYPTDFSGSERIKHMHAKIEQYDGSISALSFCVGRYVVVDKGLSASAMYDRASMAAIHVKGRFDRNIAVFDEEMRLKVLKEQSLVGEMDNALKEGQFEMWLQPQYNHSTGALIGSEALVRWRHPVKGLIPPGEFIPVFEQNGFVYELDKYVWEKSAATIRRWMDSGREVVPISVNISRYDIFRPDLVDVLCGLIHEYKIPVEMLRLEVTESAFAKSTTHIIKVVKDLIAKGFTLEIDDFGSGYSSLNTLKDVPAHVLKLDMRFLESNDNSTRGGIIVESIVRMAKWLNMSVIAEGVETSEQADYLKTIGCQYVQGYLYGKPTTVSEFEKVAAISENEPRFASIVTVNNLNNEAFWDPSSLETIMFNSFVGGASVFEYYRGKVEVLRVNDKYAEIVCGAQGTVDEAIKFVWDNHLDEVDFEKTREAMQIAMKTGEECYREVVLRDLNGIGSEKFIRAAIRVIAKSGERYLLYCMVLDVTEQRLAEKNERETGKMLRFLNETMKRLMDDTPGGFARLRVDKDGCIYGEYINKGLCKMLGYSEKEIKDNFAAEATWGVHPDDISTVSAAIRFLTKQSNVGSVKYRMQCETGDYRTFMVFGRSVDGTAGQVYLNLYFTDASEIDRLESERKELIENLPFGAAIYEVISDGSVKGIYFNKRYQELVGRDLSDVGNIDVLRAVLAKDRVLLMDRLHEALETETKRAECDLHILYGDGTYKPFHLNASILRRADERIFVYATYSPISEEVVSFRETLPVALETMMAAASDLSFVKDLNLNYLCCSRAFAKMVGLKHEKDIVGKSDFDLFDKKLASQYRADDQRLIASGESMVDHIESIPSPDGSLHYSNTSKYLLRDSYGNIIGMYGTGRDVTANREAYARLRLLTDSIPGGIAMYEISPQGVRPLYFSDGMYTTITGYPKEEYDAMAQKDAFSLVFKEDMAEIKRQLEAVVKDGTPVDCVYRTHTKSGAIKWLVLKARVSDRYGDISILNAVFFDVTDQKTAELRMQSAYDAMHIASENSGVAFWILNMAKKEISKDAVFGSGDEEVYAAKNLPESVIANGYVHPEDADAFRAMHVELYNGAKRVESTVRLKNSQGIYEWRNVVYTRLEDSVYQYPAAIGFSNNVDLQQENRVRYEHELQLRRKLIRNSITYYQINLTTNVIEEYYNQIPGAVAIEPDTPANEDTRERIFASIIEEDREKVKQVMLSDSLREAYRRGERETSVEYRRVLGELGLRWIRIDATLMERPRSGEVVAFLYAHDIDVEKKNRLAIESIMDEELESVLVLNLETKRIRLVQSKLEYKKDFQKEFDYEEMMQKAINSVVCADDVNGCQTFFKLDNIIKALSRSKVIKHVFRIQEKDKALSRKKTRAFYLDDTHRDIVLIFRDITDLYEEEQRQKSMLQKAAKKAEDASRVKSDFLSRMSHDMRTPLNAILAFSDVEMISSATEAQLLSYLEKIHASGDYLLGLINDILDMSRIEQKKLKLNEKPYSMDEFKNTINTVIGELCKIKETGFSFDDTKADVQWLEVDSVRFNQLFINILANAVKFTPSGGNVSFSIERISATPAGKPRLRFIVIDDGIGMSEVFLKHAYDSFAQEYREGFSEKNVGAGVGLSIVREIVNLMGGEISIKSRPNKGTRVVVELPIKVLSKCEKPKDKTVFSLKNVRILLCEDNRINGEIAERLLSKHGCIVEYAANGREGVNKFIASELGYYDAVLMDIRMPVLNGIEAAKEIRALARPDASTIPIIAMTADAFDDDVTDTRNAGMDEHLTKPVLPEKLFAALSNTIKNRRT